ncbi:hypothetical protein C8R47DRAFT_1078613 [Mycena vitilis]|nr:hypothetical protein C8R47DRAFT_1078613 [Mycena vitilis]
MPDASTQTDQALIDDIERTLKKEAIQYVEGRANGPPSAAMLNWLTPHLLPVEKQQPPVEKQQLPEEHGMELTLEEKQEMFVARKNRVAQMLRHRQGWAIRYKKVWPKFT